MIIIHTMQNRHIRHHTQISTHFRSDKHLANLGTNNKNQPLMAFLLHSAFDTFLVLVTNLIIV